MYVIGTSRKLQQCGQSRGVVVLFRTAVRKGRGAGLSGVESIKNFKDEHECYNSWPDV